MEEKILEILEKNSAFAQSELLREKVAKEITAHVTEFIEWIRKSCITQGFNKGNEMWIIKWEAGFFTDEKLYKYWLDNVKNK